MLKDPHIALKRPINDLYFKYFFAQLPKQMGILLFYVSMPDFRNSLKSYSDGEILKKYAGNILEEIFFNFFNYYF